MTLDVIYEDAAILVVNKPSGLVVNNSRTSGDITVQNLITTPEETPEEEDAEESEFAQRGGIVHRLDKDTSGILVVAKNEMAFKRLQKQFKRREVTKEYAAWVIGAVEDPIIEVDAPIARNPKVRFKYAVVSGGKEAQTRFEKVKESETEAGKMTLLAAFPKTGRTHQIRVHLAALDHPVAADPIYSTAAQYEKWGKVFNRLMLHAKKLTLAHPETGENMTFEAPLPSEFMIY